MSAPSVARQAFMANWCAARDGNKEVGCSFGDFNCPPEGRPDCPALAEMPDDYGREAGGQMTLEEQREWKRTYETLRSALALNVLAGAGKTKKERTALKEMAAHVEVARRRSLGEDANPEGK